MWITICDSCYLVLNIVDLIELNFHKKKHFIYRNLWILQISLNSSCTFSSKLNPFLSIFSSYHLDFGSHSSNPSPDWVLSCETMIPFDKIQLCFDSIILSNLHSIAFFFVIVFYTLRSKFEIEVRHDLTGTRTDNYGFLWHYWHLLFTFGLRIVVPSLVLCDNAWYKYTLTRGAFESD